MNGYWYTVLALALLFIFRFILLQRHLKRAYDLIHYAALKGAQKDELDAYMNFMEPTPHRGMRLMFDLTKWFFDQFFPVIAAAEDVWYEDDK